MTAADLVRLFPGPIPDGTRVGFKIMPEARGVLAGSWDGARWVRLDGTGDLVQCRDTDLFRVEER